MMLSTCYVRLALAKKSGDKKELAIWTDRVLQRGGSLPLEKEEPLPEPEVKLEYKPKKASK